MADCNCPKPTRTTRGDEDPSVCLTCSGFACEYADKGATRCPSWRCDCFIEQFPDGPMALHPEAFIVGGQDR